MDSQARTLGGWAAELVALAGRTADRPDMLDAPDARLEPSDSGQPRTPTDAANRLVHLLQTSWEPRPNEEPNGGRDGHANLQAKLDALAAVLSDPDDEDLQLDLATHVDEAAKDPDFRVRVEHLVREAWDARLAASRVGPVGICISGGGVRAASFGLGALQALQDKQQLVYGRQRAEYLAAVSGGSYIAGAVTMLVSHYGDQGKEERKRAKKRRKVEEADEGATHPSEFAGERYPFAPGTPEVEHLRRRARYLLGGGAIEAVLQFLLRLSLNLVFVASVIILIARPVGWLYGWALPSLAQADQLTADQLDVKALGLPTALGVTTAIVGVFVVLLTTFWRDWVNRPSVNAAGYVLLGAGAALLCAGFVVPMWLEWVAEQWYVAEPVTAAGREAAAPELVQGVPEAAVPWAAWSTIASIAAAMASFKAVIPDAVGKTVFSRRFRPLLMRLLRVLVALAALIAVPVGVLTVATIAMIGGALESSSWTREALVMAIPLVVLALTMILRDPLVWSLHPFYKRRLMTCYGVKRIGGSHPPAVKERPSRPPYRLSESAPPEVPCLLVCAAANVSGFGNSPAGHNVLPFVFSPLEIGFTDADGRDPSIPAPGNPQQPQKRKFSTWALEKAIGKKPEKRNITLPAAVAVTGAAFSPSMGKMTIGPIRMLMAVLNLRLGIWLPNPSSEKVWEAVRNEKGLPARPTPLYLIKETLGLNQPSSRLIYVSDGGHYENLGLVELLRKGCRTIWCIDAAGDKPGEIGTLTEAMLMAESELGVRWTDTGPLERLRTDTEATAQRRHLATMRGTHATLPFVFPDQSAGTVIVVKAGLTLDSPNYLIDYQRRYPSFPYDSTVNQLFRADRFDAYRSLGYASTKAVLSNEDTGAGRSPAHEGDEEDLRGDADESLGPATQEDATSGSLV